MDILLKIAQKVQNYYIKQFLDEYNKYKEEIVDKKNIELFGTNQQFSILTDYCSKPKPVELHDETEAQNEHSRIIVENINRNLTQYNDECKMQKKYRSDIIIMKNNEAVESIMVWPTISRPDKDFDEDDIPTFPVYRTKINNTVLIINPFPWFHCKVTFSSDESYLMGIIDVWFEKWFYNKNKPNPFFNVVHFIDGPYNNKNSESLDYFIDFGTAPPDAFVDLVNNLCRNDVANITIS